MKTKSISINVSSSIGKVSAKYVPPQNTKCVMTLAHGAGAGMDHSFMNGIAEQLAGHGIATLRFNFPYIEAGKRRPDVPAVAHKAIGAAIQKVQDLEPTLPIFSAGKSFGGRMTSQFLSQSSSDIVRGIVFFGFPLHAPGKPSIDRATHLKNIRLPMLFLQGSRDTLATMDLVKQVVSSLHNATLIEFEGADHSFKAGKNNNIENLAKSTSEWVDSILNDTR